MPIEALKPQDIFIAAMLSLVEDKKPSHAELAVALHISPSTVYESLKRLRQAKLTSPSDQGAKVMRGKFLEFLVHAVPTLYFPKKIEVVRGIPTAMWSPQFRDRMSTDKDIVTVWPYSKGKELGVGLIPIYPTIPLACSQNLELHQFMGAIEVLRIGKAREKDGATAYLQEFLGNKAEAFKDAS
jgi:DNA-binding transcriptional ArsR family regulator